MSKLVWEHFPTNSDYLKYGPQLLFYEISSKIMVGWDVDASQSQVICRSEDSESILCSNLPGGMFKNIEMYIFWTIRFFDQK